MLLGLTSRSRTPSFRPALTVKRVRNAAPKQSIPGVSSASSALGAATADAAAALYLAFYGLEDGAGRL
jgi:hypothetical protein